MKTSGEYTGQVLPVDYHCQYILCQCPAVTFWVVRVRAGPAGFYIGIVGFWSRLRYLSMLKKRVTVRSWRGLFFDFSVFSRYFGISWFFPIGKYRDLGKILKKTENHSSLRSILRVQEGDLGVRAMPETCAAGRQKNR